MKAATQTKKHIWGIKSLTLWVSTMLYAGTVLANSTIDIYLPAQSLDQSLHNLAKQTGAQILFTNDMTVKKQVKSVKGQLTIEQALQQLLQGTGLTIKDNGNNSFSIVPATQQQGRDMGQLKMIDVNARGAARASEGVAQLPVIVVDAEKNGRAEDGYLIKNITGVGIWGERSLQDTPYSMSVVSGSLIENVVAQDMNQIFKMNPVTQATGQSLTNGGVDTLWVTQRGFEVINPIINGISYTQSAVTTPMMQDIERVEIINGATGFLYGGGRVGGAVNYITKKPTVDSLKSLTVGSYGGETYFSHLDLSGQIDQDNILGYRTNLFYQNGKNESKVDREQKAISLIFDYKPTDNFYTDLKYSYKDAYGTGATSFFNIWGTLPVDRSVVQKNQSYSPKWIENELTSNKFENSIRWNINDIFTLRSNLFYEKMESRGDRSYFVNQGNNVITWNSLNLIRHFS